VVLLVLLATAPLTYSYLASMLGLKLGRRTSAIDFASASENAPSPEILLAYADIASQRAAEGNYTEAKRLLRMASGFPANAEHNLMTYVTLLHELVLTLDSLKPRLDQLQDLIASGAVTQARGNNTEIEGLIGEASRRLDLLFSSLDRIGSIYPIDTANQHHDLETLSNTLQSFEQRLANLKDQLDTMDRRATTQLDLQVYPNPVQAEGSLDIWGELQSGDVGLGSRIVEVWMNGVQVADLTLDQLGRFAWQYVVSNGSRADKLELYAHYLPIGEDVSRFRPAKSATVTVPVNYRSVTLTISASSKRVLVLENFSVQGQLADAFGNLLAGKTVDLLVDGDPVNSSITNSAGKYSMSTTLPTGTPQGEHQLCTRFGPKQGIYATANSENITIQLYYLKPTFTQLGLSGFPMVGGEFIILSGQTAPLEGRLEIDSKPFAQSLVIAFLGDRELGRALTDTTGIFRISVGVSFDLSDVNKILVVFVPASPWMASVTGSIVVRVLNSAVTGLAIGAAFFALLVFSGRSISIGTILRRRAVPRRRPEAETIAVEKPEATEGAVTASALLPLRDFEVELQLGVKSEEPRPFVKAVYWEIRRMLAELLGARGEQSETPREFSARVSDKLGSAVASLPALTQLFELAEYSQHAISRIEAQEAVDHALRVAEESSVRVKS
jgi:hypothetical protein